MSRTQRAVVLSDDGLSFRHAHPVPPPLPGEIPVRVLTAGICETDLQLRRGYMHYRGVLGHEFVGIAEAGRFAGQRVVGEINCACRQCPTCREGFPNHCPHRTVLGIFRHDGAFADTVHVPEANLHRVPDEVDNDQAVFVEPLAAAFQLLRQLPDLAGRRVLVLGDGRLGQLCAQVLATTNARLTVIGKHPAKLALLSARGIETALRSDLAPDQRADIVVEATGSPSGLEDAFAWLRPRGTLVLKTTIAGTPALSWAPIVIHEFQVLGSRCGPFEPALKALADGTIDVRPLITARYPLEDALAAFKAVEAREGLKTLLDVANSE